MTWSEGFSILPLLLVLQACFLYFLPAWRFLSLISTRKNFTFLVQKICFFFGSYVEIKVQKLTCLMFNL